MLYASFLLLDNCGTEKSPRYILCEIFAQYARLKSFLSLRDSAVNISNLNSRCNALITTRGLFLSVEVMVVTTFIEKMNARSLKRGVTLYKEKRLSRWRDKEGDVEQGSMVRKLPPERPRAEDPILMAELLHLKKYQGESPDTVSGEFSRKSSSEIFIISVDTGTWAMACHRSIHGIFLHVSGNHLLLFIDLRGVPPPSNIIYLNI